MSARTSQVRPSRRVVQRRQRVIEDSDDSDAPVKAQDASSEEEENFTLAPQRSARRPLKREPSLENRATPRTAVPQRRVSEVEAMETKSSDSAQDLESTSSSRKTVAIGRRSVRAGRKSQVAIVPEEDHPPLPTPEPSATPEPMAQCQSPQPLADITTTTINEQPQIIETKPLAPVEAKEVDRPSLERPMDIVIRARAKAQPLVEETPELKARIVLTYLILTNFKSYAGRQEVGPFHSSFSSVVGPNGSGKSNVIDSLLFVFGFRASKMRQGKLSALIHNSAGFPDLDHCAVEVHFQEVLDLPGGGHEVVPNSTLIVSRKVFKNNSSTYYINGSLSNFTAVTTLLKDRGVDLDHKRFLILQGEVESIAQMKPKAASEHDDGLLEYLEDIIGTSKYKSAIDESATRTEELNEVCLEKNNRLQHVEKERKGLEAKKDAALAFIKDENDLAIKQSALYQLYIQECEDNIAVTEEVVGQMQEQLRQETERHKGGEDSINTLKKRHVAEVKQFEKLEKTTQATLQQLAKIDKETVKFEEKKKHLSAKIRKLEKTKSSSQAAASEATAHLDRISDDLARNLESIAELEGRLQAEEQELGRVRETLKGKTRGLSDQISKKQHQLEPWTAQINEKRSAIAVAQSELAILKERDNAGARALEDVKARLLRIQEARSAKAAELEEHQLQQLTLEKDRKRLQTRLDKLAQSAPDSKSKLSSARQKADEARATLAASQTQGNVITGLMRLKESGRIDGFHGRLGNLGTIDQKYDVAVSTACAALDNLVVDSVEVGSSCIEYLRKNNLGRANFILLDRLSSRDLSTIDTPEGIPRVFDLVKAKEEKFRPAFYSVLQNMLVAQDLEQANRVAYGAKRWRVVTLDGQIIDKSGTMSGGGNTKAKGKMSSKIVQETTRPHVEKLAAEQEDVEQEFHDIQKEQHDVEASLRDVTNAIPELETNMQKCALEIDSMNRDIKDAQRRHSELSGGSQPKVSEEYRMKALQCQIVDLEKKVEALLESSSGIEAEIALLQEKIMEIGGVQLRTQKARVDGLREQINTLTEETSSVEVSKAKTAQQLKKHEKTQDLTDTELNQVAIELQSLDEEVEKQSKDDAGIREEAEEMEEALEQKREGMNALKAELDQKTADLNESRGIELEMRNRLEESLKVWSENQKRFKYWDEKLGKLNIQSVSDLGEDLPDQSLTTYTRDELQDLEKDTLKGDIAILEAKTQETNIELGVLAEYRRRVEEHAARSQDLSEAVSSRNTVKRQCEELRRLRLEGFMEGFSTISLRLKEMYQMITMGGNAELELVDSLDPFSEGILFSVMPPKKSWKNISNLSGGEKTLSSLALVFALHHYKPTPLYVMDEIDAALDFRNVSIVASYIKERTKNAQFIVISLRNNMFELASRLVGVYKVNHMTKSVTVENRDYIARSS